MVHHIYSELYQAHYQTVKGIEIAFTPLGCMNTLVYMSVHLAQPTALPALNLGVTSAMLKLINTSHSTVYRTIFVIS